MSFCAALAHPRSASHRDFFNGNGAVQGISVATVLVVPAVRGVREIVSAIVDSPEAAAAVA